MDQITLQRIELLHPKVRTEAFKIYTDICERLKGKAFCRFAYTLRTFAEQDNLYAQGRTKPGPVVTYAKGGQSYHNYGLAIDIVLIVDTDGNGSYETASWDFKKDFDGDGKADFEEIDFVFNLHGWKGLYKVNGKRWDFPHFQKTFDITISQLQSMFNTKKFIPNTNYVAI